MVLKPASQTPFSAIAIAILAERAGLPKGPFSVITGSAREIGGEMTANPTVRTLTFTGSTEVGAELYRQSAPTIKKLGLELGGNAPFIVFDDAAGEGAIIAKFRNNGQTCVCANRIYVQDGSMMHSPKKLAGAVGKLVTGNGFDEGVILGPLIDRAALEKVEEHVADALAREPEPSPEASAFRTATHSTNLPYLPTSQPRWRSLEKKPSVPSHHCSSSRTRLMSFGRPIDLAPKFYPVLSLLRQFWVAVFASVAAGWGAEPFRLRSTASRRGLMV